MISPEDLAKAMHKARYAIVIPSGRELQPWNELSDKSKEIKIQIAQALLAKYEITPRSEIVSRATFNMESDPIKFEKQKI